MKVPVVAVYAAPALSLFHYSVPIILFRDILPEEHLFDVRPFTSEPGRVETGSGVNLEITSGLEAADVADIIIIPYWAHPETKPGKELLLALNRAWRRGAVIVGLCLGTYVLAYAGLLNHRRASTHWEFERDFSQRFPSVRLDSDSLYAEDQGILTSAGTAAGIDCCLYLIRKLYGRQTANRIARRMVVAPHREGGQAQYSEQITAGEVKDPRLNRLLRHLRASLHETLDLDTLAGIAGMSRRTLTRRFMAETGMTVRAWVTEERLRRSQLLLETTYHSIETVASLSGFQSPVAFRENFRHRYGISPSEWRKSFQWEE